jgi:hypothetical protein
MSKGLAHYDFMVCDARRLPEPARSTIMDGVENWRGYVIILCLGALAIVGVVSFWPDPPGSAKPIYHHPAAVAHQVARPHSNASDDDWIGPTPMQAASD